MKNMGLCLYISKRLKGLLVYSYLKIMGQLHRLNAHAVVLTFLTHLNIHNSLVCKVDLNSSCFSSAQVILIPLLTLLNIRNSLVCMLVILSVMARHIVKAFAVEPWMFYLGKFYFYFYFLFLSFFRSLN